MSEPETAWAIFTGKHCQTQSIRRTRKQCIKDWLSFVNGYTARHTWESCKKLGDSVAKIEIRQVEK